MTSSRVSMWSFVTIPASERSNGPPYDPEYLSTFWVFDLRGIVVTGLDRPSRLQGHGRAFPKARP
jgi:hypothetical protein